MHYDDEVYLISIMEFLIAGSGSDDAMRMRWVSVNVSNWEMQNINKYICKYI